MKPIVQISLDFIDLDEALDTARLAMRAGIDWLEAGTPLVLSHGTRGVEVLRREFPDTPIIADLKIMDGGYGETRLMAQAGATHIVVMERAHPETVKQVVKAGRDFGIEVMGDNLGASDRVAAARRLEDLGCGFIIHHIGFDERRGIAARGERQPSPLDELRAVCEAVSVPVQAVGGLSLDEAVQCPAYGAPLVVIGAPLIGTDDLEATLRQICQQVHGQTG